MSTIKLFFFSIIVFFVLDMVWLGYFAKDLYFSHYATWLRLKDDQLLPVWWAIALVYSLFSLAILIFVLPLAKGVLAHAFIYGAAMGFIIYGVYDFTCIAIFNDWPVVMAFIDWAWGTFLCGFSATLIAYCARFF